MQQSVSHARHSSDSRSSEARAFGPRDTRRSLRRKPKFGFSAWHDRCRATPSIVVWSEPRRQVPVAQYRQYVCVCPNETISVEIVRRKNFLLEKQVETTERRVTRYACYSIFRGSKPNRGRNSVQPGFRSREV